MKNVIGAIFGVALLLVAARILTASTAKNSGLKERPSTARQSESASRGATGDASHGEDLYYFHCNFCHVKNAAWAPSLSNVYKRSQLWNGKPVNDESVTEQIKNGSTGMPEFRYMLSDKDIADLEAYFREGKCCTDPEKPPVNARYRAPANPLPVEVRNNLHGGPQGIVRTATGLSLEGFMIQLESEAGSVRTTVFSNEDGHYEFPKLAPGKYTLRIVRPLDYHPSQAQAVATEIPTHQAPLDPEYKTYVRQSVSIDGAVHLNDVVMDRSSRGQAIDATPEYAVQLTGVEWFMNLAGSGEEKQRMGACLNCHSMYQILRGRHTEDGWSKIINRMFRMTHVLDTRPEYSRGATEQDRIAIARFLGRVRGPESKDDPYVTRPMPTGEATKVIVTEYEMPHMRGFPQEVAGDSQGNIYYINERGPYFGKLDPRSGVVEEFRMPDFPGVYPGANSLAVDRHDVPWLWQGGTWNSVIRILRFDPQKKTFHVAELPERQGDDPVRMAMGPDGTIWAGWNNFLNQIDPNTGKILKQYPFKGGATFATDASEDGKYIAAGGWYLDVTQGKMMQVRGAGGASKGGFDADDNAWSGGRGGLVRVDMSKGRSTLYPAPTPYVFFSEAMPDKNGEVWSAYDNGGRMARFNPKTERWIEYEMPDPYVRDQRTWIDNSTSPVSVWFVNLSEITHVQPLD